MRTLAAPRITTLDGRRAVISIGSSTNQPGMTLDVLPERAGHGDTLLLTLDARPTEPVDLRHSVLTDSELDATSRSRIHAVNAVGYVTRSLTNTVTVKNGEMLLLPFESIELPGRPRGVRHVIAITPSLVDPAGNLIRRE